MGGQGVGEEEDKTQDVITDKDLARALPDK